MRLLAIQKRIPALMVAYIATTIHSLVKLKGQQEALDRTKGDYPYYRLCIHASAEGGPEL